MLPRPSFVLWSLAPSSDNVFEHLGDRPAGRYVKDCFNAMDNRGASTAFYL